MHDPPWDQVSAAIQTTGSCTSAYAALPDRSAMNMMTAGLMGQAAGSQDVVEAIYAK